MSQVPKQVKEYLLHGYEMEDALQTGEILVSSNANGSLTATIYDENDVDVTASIVEGTPTLVGTTVQVMLKEGTADGTYNIEWLIPTSLGQVLEEDATLVVYNKKG